MTALYPAPSVADQFRPPSLHDAFVGQSVGPQPEDTAGAEHPSCASESCGLVEVRVARVQEIARRVVDVHQDRVVGVLVLPTKRNTCADRLEEVRGYKAASGVGRQLLAQRYEVPPVPLDYLRQRLDHVERPDAVVGQDCARRVPETQASDGDVQAVAVDVGRLSSS